MRMSPACMRWARACTVCSVGAPAGTISHAIRGFPSLLTKSSSDEEAMEPSPAIFFTLSALKSVTTTSCPPRIRRRVMLAPILPRPTIPNRIILSFSILNRFSKSCRILLWLKTNYPRLNPCSTPWKVSANLAGMPTQIVPGRKRGLCPDVLAMRGGRVRRAPGSLPEPAQP